MRLGTVILLVVALTACGDDIAPQQRRGAALPTATVIDAIDWSQSVGIFIGVETFRDSASVPPPVVYAADDAIDLAWLFSQELSSLLRPERTLLLLSGRPDKSESRAHLLTMQREGVTVIDDFDADAVYTHVHTFANAVGENGVLILFAATHGATLSGAHVLLTPDATNADPKGMVLGGLLQSIPPGRSDRLLLFVDACRRPFSPAPARMFEDLPFPGRYAIFAAAAPGGYAYPDETAHNGYFTSALIDALRCRAASDADGFLTPGAVAVVLNDEVRKRTGERQRPEARFGGLEDLPLLRCAPALEVGRIVAPVEGARVDSMDDVAVLVNAPDLYLTVLVCASNGRCWRQNAKAEPRIAPVRAISHVRAEYGSPDRFTVYAVLTADKEFLRGETEFPSLPRDRRANRIVYWLEPVTVIFEEES